MPLLKHKFYSSNALVNTYGINLDKVIVSIEIHAQWKGVDRDIWDPRSELKYHTTRCDASSNIPGSTKWGGARPKLQAAVVCPGTPIPGHHYHARVQGGVTHPGSYA